MPIIGFLLISIVLSIISMLINGLTGGIDNLIAATIYTAVLAGYGYAKWKAIKFLKNNPCN